MNLFGSDHKMPPQHAGWETRCAWISLLWFFTYPLLSLWFISRARFQADLVEIHYIHWCTSLMGSIYGDARRSLSAEIGIEVLKRLSTLTGGGRLSILTGGGHCAQRWTETLSESWGLGPQLHPVSRFNDEKSLSLSYCSLYIYSFSNTISEGGFDEASARRAKSFNRVIKDRSHNHRSQAWQLTPRLLRYSLTRVPI